MKVVERLTPGSAERIDYQVTIDGPKVYTRPWTVALPFNRDPSYRIFEYPCHEGNLAIPNELSAGRAREREASATR